MSRIGIVKEVNDQSKEVFILGFGECTGSAIVESEDLGIEIEVPVFKLDSGTRMENVYGYYWAEESAIKTDIESYESKGYTVINLNI